jgi:hypothetical protein
MMQARGCRGNPNVQEQPIVEEILKKLSIPGWRAS